MTTHVSVTDTEGGLLARIIYTPTRVARLEQKKVMPSCITRHQPDPGDCARAIYTHTRCG